MRNDDEEKALQKLLLVVMKKVIAAYPLEQQAFQPGQIRQDLDDSDPYSSFPNYPRIRHPRKYQADRPRGRTGAASGGGGDQEETEEEADADLSPEEFCKKNAYSHPTLHPGT